MGWPWNMMNKLMTQISCRSIYQGKNSQGYFSRSMTHFSISSRAHSADALGIAVALALLVYHSAFP
jgi:hypothetical protein